jgi:hypothetical protein
MFLSTEIGDVEMRKDDHQLIQNLYISTFTKADGKSVKYDVEDTGFGFKTDVELQRKDTALPTTCKMKRPGVALRRAGDGSQRTNGRVRLPDDSDTGSRLRAGRQSHWNSSSSRC